MKTITQNDITVLKMIERENNASNKDFYMVVSAFALVQGIAFTIINLI